jgi:hypothetical protein
MASSTCETIRLGSGSSRRGLDVGVVSNGQSLKATCAAMVATYCRGIWHKAANGKTNAGGRGVEV